jgi:hypothetical protein
MGNGEALDPGAAPAPPWWRFVSGVVMCGFLLVAGFYLLTEHTAHLWSVLPFLLLLSCPLMHVFHHHGHGNSPAGPPPVPGDGQGGT